MLQALVSWQFEISMLLYGMSMIVLLWLVPIANFKLMVGACTVAWLVNAYHIMGTTLPMFGFLVPSGVPTFCIIASMVGLTAARVGTSEARGLMETVCYVFVLICAYELLRAVTGRTGQLTSVEQYTHFITNAVVALVSFYFYVVSFLMLRWYTSALSWKRSARSVLGVTAGTFVLYPALVAITSLETPAAADTMDVWVGALIRTLFHGVLVATIMTVRHFYPQQIVYDV